VPGPLRETLEEHNRRQRSYFERTRKRTMEPVRTPYVCRQVEEVMRAAQLAPSHHVLEVGCGMGRHTLGLAERGVQVEGFDLSPVLLERLWRSDGGRYNIPLHCGDVLRPPPELKERFDAVVGFFTLHHLYDVGRCLEAMVRLLRPGGRLVFLEPNFRPLTHPAFVRLAHGLAMRKSWTANARRRRSPAPGTSGNASVVHSSTLRPGASVTRRCLMVAASPGTS